MLLAFFVFSSADLKGGSDLQRGFEGGCGFEGVFVFQSRISRGFFSFTDFNSMGFSFSVRTRMDF